MELSVPFQLAVITVVAFLCQWASWRIKLPAILPLLISGLLLGSVTGLIQPRDLFGDLLLPGVSLAVSIILFEGALTLRFDEIRGLEKTVRRLVTWGALVTWGVVTLSAWGLLDLPLGLALLFGALVVVTGPTVIVPLLRSVRPKASVARLLRWEGIVIDPLGAILAVLAYELVVATGQQGALLHGLWLFFQAIAVGTVIGVVVAFILSFLLARQLVPEYLRSFLVLSMVIGSFVLANGLSEESGLVAVTVAGIVLANRKGVRTDDILHFKENLSVMLISVLFIVLAARLEMDQLLSLGATALLVLAIIQLVARPLSVWVSTLGSSLNWREKALLAWIAPRGIVAAAVSALFAQRLQENGVEGAELLVPLTFMVIIGTVALQSVTARPLARLLKVAEPGPRGFLIIGANPVARAVGEALHENNFPVILIDSSWESIRAARMKGLGTFYGNPVSSHADQHLDLVGYGKLLGLSPRRELNTMATMRYRLEFGEANVYSLPWVSEKEDKHEVAAQHRGATLFSSEASYARLASLISQGAEIRRTRITDEFSFDAYLKVEDRQVMPLFAIDPRDRAHVFTAESQPEPKPGWAVIGLIKEEQTEKAEK
ncbi:MAG: sodium:proton antiporter [Alcanivorax sp.]|uniref:cation:proton antiporter n=1 Tax=Alloalcanivorax marinus TaxID=1177169 RepID=UPI0019581C1D|nr:sodium:proton antiporter [Alloalcanivorax marinus]MBM7334457.1 sodium:proton antiporter [Alloalcanivorax marinus]MCU5788395.1 NhaP-type Na+/H+ and K+/H+ antiporter [Alloalcanivorax marinus]